MANKEKQMRQEVIIDMNEFLVTYAATILDPKKNISQIVYNTGKDDLTKLDDLFKDNGFGRTNKFVNIGEGFLVDAEHTVEDAVKDEAQRLAKDAMSYLGSHIDFFETWRTD